MVSLKWTLQAEMDLQNIYDYISLDSKYYADIQIKRIKEKARLLKNHPKLGRIVPELDNDNIRELIFGNYRIIYRLINPKQVDIISIYHTSRLLKLF